MQTPLNCVSTVTSFHTYRIKAMQTVLLCIAKQLHDAVKNIQQAINEINGKNKKMTYSQGQRKIKFYIETCMLFF